MSNSKDPYSLTLAELEVRQFPPLRPPVESPAIAMDRTPVRVLGDPLSEVWWRGRQWAVTSYGIEALDGRYAIEAKRLTEQLKSYPWPQHLAGKDWVDLDDFGTAWLVGLLLHGHGKDQRVTAKRVLKAFGAARAAGA